MDFEPEVSEETGREAIGRVLEGLVDTQREAGVPIPGGRAVEEMAHSFALQQIRVHEERVRTGAYEKRARPEPPAGESPARIDRGEVGDNTSVIARDLEDSPLGRQHLAARPPPLHIALLEGRLELLRYFPCEPGCTGPATDAGHVHPWGEKLMKAVDEAVVHTRKAGWLDSDPKTTERLCDEMMKVVELSGAPIEMGGLGLGDYRELRPETYVRLPRRGGLVPLSQLPKHTPVIAAE